MRKDYVITEDVAEDETRFVERYWTQVWESAGGPKGRAARIPHQDEFRVIAPHLASLPKGARILDGGCGLGDWALYLHGQGFAATGLDLSAQTVAKLQAGYPHVEFAAGDLRATPFPDGHFDAYLSWGVFEHFEAGPGECLREALRILRPGGLLFVSVPLENLRLRVIDFFDRPRPVADNQRFYQYRFTRDELARELSQAGFETVSIHAIHKRQGVLRCLHHQFWLPYELRLTRALAFALSPFVPGSWMAHMQLAVARKPSAS